MWELLSHFAAACDPNKTFFGLPTWYKYLDLQTVVKPGQPVRCEIPNFTVPGDVALIALALLEAVLRIAGLVAVAFIMYGGFQFLTSQGDPEASKHARQTIINAIIGLVIALFATTLVAFIGTRLV